MQISLGDTGAGRNSTISLEQGLHRLVKKGQPASLISDTLARAGGVALAHLSSPSSIVRSDDADRTAGLG